jgi:WD40 repeat protein
MQGHTGPILKIITLEPQKLEKITRERIPDDPKIITCSLDNTIRLWDAKEMALVTVMESPEYSEISCMTFLVNCCLVATGHEDGAIRLWNLEINSSVTLKCEDKNKHQNSISCILGIYHNDSEFLVCGSYDGKVSVWEISEKRSTSGQNSMLSSTIFPQLKTVIDNTKTPTAGKFDPTEILCLSFYSDEQP